MESEISKFLRRDHDQLDGVFREFQKGKEEKDFVKARGYFIRFKCGLLRHMELEEEILFSFYEKRSGKHEMGLTSTMRQEHRRLRGMINTIFAKIEETNFATQKEEEELFSFLASHSVHEESALYPAIDIVTNEEEKKEIFSRMKKFSERRCNECA